MTKAEKELIEMLRKNFDLLRAFQRSRPDLPQGEYAELSARDRKKILQAMEIAGAEAQR
jgi:hypothetical protein